MKKFAYMAGGYLIAAWIYNRYVSAPTAFKLPFDFIGNAGVGY